MDAKALKTCTKCHGMKPISAFFADRRKASGVKPICKACDYAAKERRRLARIAKLQSEQESARLEAMRADPQGYAEAQRRLVAERIAEAKKADKRARCEKYGITPERFDELYEAQGGACAICGDVGVKLVIDHSHLTGAVRGLLCTRCNAGIGMLRDSQWVLEEAARYLRYSNLRVPIAAAPTLLREMCLSKSEYVQMEAVRLMLKLCDQIDMGLV